MKTLKLGILFLYVAAALALPLWLRQGGHAVLRSRQEALRMEETLARELAAQNARRSNQLSGGHGDRDQLTEKQVAELLQLRNEASQLRRIPAEADQLRRKILRHQAALADLANAGGEDEHATALLADELDVRRARVEQLKQWLAENPKESIPELQLLTEDSWIRSAGWARVTDDDFRSWMSSQRANAEMAFAQLAVKAMKQYAHDNGGALPADPAQLQPYFNAPVDDATLQRYEMVPANTLVKFLADTGGDSVMTQRAPINENDMRVAISAKGQRSTLEPGRWASTQ